MNYFKLLKDVWNFKIVPILSTTDTINLISTNKWFRHNISEPKLINIYKKIYSTNCFPNGEILIEASKMGDFEIVQRKKGMLFINEYAEKALEEASIFGHENIVKFILKVNNDIMVKFDLFYKLCLSGKDRINIIDIFENHNGQCGNPESVPWDMFKYALKGGNPLMAKKQLLFADLKQDIFLLNDIHLNCSKSYLKHICKYSNFETFTLFKKSGYFEPIGNKNYCILMAKKYKRLEIIKWLK